jgi:hypothetical protein
MAAATMIAADRWIHAMNDTINDLAQNDEDIFIVEDSDAALEAAASTRPGAAVSFPAAPTVSVLVVCCGNDDMSVRHECSARG